MICLINIIFVRSKNKKWYLYQEIIGGGRLTIRKHRESANVLP